MRVRVICGKLRVRVILTMLLGLEIGSKLSRRSLSEKKSFETVVL